MINGDKMNICEGLEHKHLKKPTRMNKRTLGIPSFLNYSMDLGPFNIRNFKCVSTKI